MLRVKHREVWQCRLDRVAPWLLLGAIVVYILVFTLLSSLKLALFRQGFDMAGNEQAIWNTLHGRLFRTSVFAFMEHDVDDGLVLLQLPLALVYGLYPSPYTLLTLQSMALGLAAWPLYLIGRAMPLRPWQALVLALLLLAHPWTQRTNMYEWQLRSFLVPFALAALLFLWREQLWPYLLFLLLLLCTKTEAALTVAMFGCYALLLRRSWPYVVVPIVVGAVWFVFQLWVVVPAFATGEFIGTIYSYGRLGNSVGDVIVTALTHPLLVLEVMLEPAKLRFLLELFGLQGFLALLSPVSLLGLPVLLVNIISPNPVQYSLNYQYQALTVPFLLVGAAQGLLRVARLCATRLSTTLEQRRVRAEQFVSVGLLLLFVTTASFTAVRHNAVLSLWRNHETPARVADARAMLAQVPPDAAVAASSFLAPHLAQRQQIYFFPGNKSYPAEYIARADYIVADNGPQVRSSERTTLATYLSSPEWRLVAQVGDFVLLRRITTD